jgi:hypothetical protein
MKYEISILTVKYENNEIPIYSREKTFVKENSMFFEY